MSTPLLRLYPAGFRRDFGDEIAASYHEAVEGAGRWARAREAGDIVAHALRLRLGLGSSQRGGPLFAAAAPFALAATAAYAAFTLVSLVGDRYISGSPDFLVPLSYVMGGCALVTLTGAVLALGGRFAAGARWACAGTVTYAAVLYAMTLPAHASMPWQAALFLAAPSLVAALPLACPPDLRPPGRVRSGAGRVALTVWALVGVVAVALWDARGIGSVVHWRLGVPVAAALLLAGRRPPARIRTTGRFALAAAPFLAIGFCAGVVDADTLLPSVAVLAGAAAALRLRRAYGRRSDPARPR
ncbi:hypothetical protein [Streptomyces sp. NPDC057682]|uniref:hypothetical protein n=1 Tax=unclassified Streptomyces TaxID=2593676 RepID=UPI0036591EE4